MRFLSDGPNIPDRLLTARDDGQVVFLCGAGVSMPCQLPSFKTLTEHVLRRLRVPADADAQQAFAFWKPPPPGQREIPDEAKPSFDLIFNMLQQSYGRDEVGKIVAERLAVPAAVVGPPRWHRTVARLSADPGRPFGEFTEDRPFKGLVENHPARAMNALELAAQRGEYPPELWRTLINDWPDAAPEDATRVFHNRLRQLPAEILQSIHHAIGDWIRDKLPAVAERDEPYALALLDDLLDRLLIAGVAITESSIGNTFEGGQRVTRSRRTYAHAINSLVGKATEALASILNARKLPKDSRLPGEFSSRFERLLASPGEGSDHAVSCLAIRLPWLTNIAPDWSRARLLPLFAADHPATEPAWNGLLHSHHIPGPELFAEIKTQLLSIFPRIYTWNWVSSDLERAHRWVIQTCIWHHEDDRYTSYDEAIACIRSFSSAGRVNVIHFLGQVGRSADDAWENAVAPFINNAWPREAQYQIEATSAAFISLLEDCGDHFPAVLEAARPFLRRIHRGHHWLYRFYKDIGNEGEAPISANFPRETLALMDAIIPDDPSGVPFDLAAVLEQMVEAWPGATRDRRFIRLQELVAAR